MANNPLDIEVILSVAVSARASNAFGVKDVETFVLHRPHVEEVDGDNHIDVEIGSRPKRSSSHFMELMSEVIAYGALIELLRSTNVQRYFGQNGF